MQITFAESLAPVAQMTVVSCRTDVLPMYKRKGYVETGRLPIGYLLQPELLTRDGLEFVVLRKKTA